MEMLENKKVPEVVKEIFLTKNGINNFFVMYLQSNCIFNFFLTLIPIIINNFSP